MADTTSASSGAGSQRSEEPIAPTADPSAPGQAGTGARDTEPEPAAKGKLLGKLRRKSKDKTDADEPAPVVGQTPAGPVASPAAGSGVGEESSEEFRAAKSSGADDSADADDVAGDEVSGEPAPGDDATEANGSSDTDDDAVDAGESVEGDSAKTDEAEEPDAEASGAAVTDDADGVPDEAAEEAAGDSATAGEAAGETAVAAGPAEVEEPVDDLPDNYQDMIIGLPKPNPQAVAEADDAVSGEGGKSDGFVDHLPPNYEDIIIGLPKPAGEKTEAQGNETQAADGGKPAAEGEAAEDEAAEDGADAAEGDKEQSAAEQAAMALITALMRLREALASSRLPIDVVGADEARQQRKAMLDQLDDYVLPRLVQLEAPVLAVVGGSTGAGKSTLVNTLVGHIVSDPGVLRPTTRSPVLVHNPADSDWFAGDRVLPGLARSTGDEPGGHDDPGTLRLVAADTIPQGLAILDAPDIDSVVEANRELAAQLLAAADLWLFVTTAARYADAVPWDFLKDAAERSTAIAVVLDRVPPDSIEDVSGHLAHMLLERGLGDSPLFAIAESDVDDDGLLPDEVVAQVKEWLTELAADANARAAVVRRTLQGAVTAMTKKTPAFAAAVRAQADTVVELRASAETAYVRAVKDVGKATQDGSMLRGEVLARWQEFVGTGELLKGLQTNVGRLRDKVRNAIAGKPQPTRDVTDAVESGLESLLREHAEAAAERAEESWQSTLAGRQLLEAGERDLGRASRTFNAEAGRMVREWQGYVLELVRKEGAEKRSTARILAYGVNGLGIALMIVIFASTAGIPTGAEVGVGAGTAAVGQKLLEAVFGDQAVRTLATKARRDLDSRVRALMDAELSRYLMVLDQHPVDPDAPRRLTEAARAVEDCT